MYDKHKVHHVSAVLMWQEYSLWEQHCSEEPRSRALQLQGASSLYLCRGKSHMYRRDDLKPQTHPGKVSIAQVLLQAASTPSAYQTADASAQSASAQAPSTGAYQGSDMQTQANSQQQAPTFGLVGSDKSTSPIDWHSTAFSA